ncbi:SDR family NAD(P)-dependent oxidoreductase [Roseovarius sp. D0-M9]|uniref:SDR family NAD(P)-dependent oxidoreductase n=1 Tax=Roseovarius sp. D0-M9 TaxID=3127117 RepID=UPI0030101497
MVEAKQRVAVVTGGLAGIGLAISQALLAAGLRVVIGTRSGGGAKARSAVEQNLGADASIYPLDVRDEASVTAFFEAVTQDIGEVDILVNSAGVTAHETVSGHSLSSWQDVLETNLTGPFLTIRACLPGMKARGWGRIVNLASTAARTAVADHPAYCASKAGLLGLSRAVALEGAPCGVSCVTVSPTWVETDMLRQSAAIMANKSGRSYDAEIAALAAVNPQNRLVQPQEVAALVAFLCSDAAPALTMEDISVNAGAHW